MTGLLRIARTEVLEHRRQPGMLAFLVANYLLWVVVFGGVFVALDRVEADPAATAMLRDQYASMGVELDAVLRVAVSSMGAILFTNLPLYVAILAGTSVIHDRTTGTLPFHMLAPLTRRQLLAGKLLGAMAIPLVLHLTLAGPACLALGRLDVLAPWSVMLGGSAAWWVSLLVGGPASAALVGALGTVISALSSDVRTSMQGTSFFMGILSLGIGVVLVDGTAWGLLPQLAFAGACLVGAAAILLVGAAIISRDLA